MTSEDVQSELDKYPFIPFRIHLVSGKTFDVMMPSAGWMLQNAVLLLHDPKLGEEAGYDVISLWNIERLEQLREREMTSG